MHTMKGFIPVVVPHILGDKSNDWLVERVVATPTIGFGWPPKPKPKWLLAPAVAVGAGKMFVPEVTFVELDRGDEEKLAHGSAGMP